MFVHGKHQTTNKANTFLLYTMAFGHQNKLNFSHLDGPRCLAVEVPVHKLLPTKEVEFILHITTQNPLKVVSHLKNNSIHTLFVTFIFTLKNIFQFRLTLLCRM